MGWRTKLAVAGATAGAAAIGPHLAVRGWATNPDPTGGRPLEMPEGRESTVTAPDGTSLSVLTAGDPTDPPVVLVHGWTGDKRIWGPVATRLVASGRHVIAYDQRGHGRSGVGPAGRTIDALGDDLCAVIEALDLSRAVVAGHSMGGMAVQSFAIRHPAVAAERVATLVLVSTAAAQISPLPPVRSAARALASPRVDAAVRRPVLGPVLMRGSVGAAPSLVHLEATRSTFLATSAETRREFLDAMGKMDLRPELANVDAHTIIVSGSRDTLLAHRLSKALAAVVPGSELVALAKVGHQIPFEAPDRLTEILVGAISPPSSPHALKGNAQ